MMLRKGVRRARGLKTTPLKGLLCGSEDKERFEISGVYISEDFFVLCRDSFGAFISCWGLYHYSYLLLCLRNRP
jgi:hypothetical protein